MKIAGQHVPTGYGHLMWRRTDVRRLSDAALLPLASIRFRCPCGSCMHNQSMAIREAYRRDKFTPGWSKDNESLRRDPLDHHGPRSG